jgi:hypothetical protein
MPTQNSALLSLKNLKDERRKDFSFILSLARFRIWFETTQFTVSCFGASGHPEAS